MQTETFSQPLHHGNFLLKPFQLFDWFLEPIPHVFLSLLINIMSYAVSVSFKGNYRERYAEMFVDIDKYITNHENAREPLTSRIFKKCCSLAKTEQNELWLFSIKNITR
jgi:hypothetical protein